MTLFKPGDRICGRFAVEALVGVGGMSEVYRGRDEKLHDRPVAIKALRTFALEDPAAVHDRLQAEVRSLSTLNHPHIAVLYDVCAHEDVDVIVMELVDGETLATKLRKGRLPEAEALRYASQIADALAYAHRRGVVHHDVKPSNIVITAQGAKLLDFGLAFLAQPGAAPATGAEDTARAGTPFYMAPEQMAGLELDQRSDIYALGLVICQMLTGFTPDSVSGLSTRTLIGGLLEQIASRPLRMVVERCLASDPDERWLHAGDLRHALAAVGEAAASPPSDPSVTRRALVSGRAAAAGLAVGLVLLAGWWIPRASPPTAEYQFTISPPPGTRFVSLETGGPAVVSPDGQTVAFVAADQSGTTRVWTRALRALVATPLYGTEGAAHPFWSPDSRFIAFFGGGRLQRITATGGATRTIAPAAQGRGGSWSPDGIILFAPGFTEPVYQVPADGGEVQPVTVLDFSNSETSHRWPVFLPDGRRFLFFVRSDRPEVLGLYLGTLDSPERVRLSSLPSSAVYAQAVDDGEGYLLYVQQGFLTAQRFSPSDGRLLGEASRLVQLPTPEEDTSVAPVSASNTGVLVHGGGSSFRQALTWLDRTGRELDVIAAQGQYRNLRLSPDGRQVALERLEIRTGLANVWVFDLDRDVQQRLALAPGASYSPVWSPDGRSVLSASYRGAQWDLVRRGAANESEVAVLRPGPPRGLAQAATDWSRDGTWIIYQERGEGARDQWDLAALEISTGKTMPLASSEHNEHQGQLSPDGSWLAYTSNESGRDEVYIQRFPAMPPRLRVSTAGGSQPKWRGDGDELFYVDASQALRSVAVDRGASPLSLSASRTLFALGSAPATGFVFLSNYDVDRAGARFLVARPPEAQNVHQQLTIVVNWLAELRVP